MKIAFTICSNNYLAHAKALGDSIRVTNPDYEFYIGLVDQFSSEIDYEKEIGHKIILSEDIGIPDFDDLWKKFSIIELNTCVKPFFFEYLISKNCDLEYIYFLDPDTYIFNSFKLIENEFGKNNILLTPHIVTPINLDGKQPDEPIFLNYGIYNLGFLGLKNPTLSFNLINWWKERTYNLGYIRTCQGLFVDQLWFNLVPLFFENVKYTTNLGINMGPWNIHERYLSIYNDSYRVNEKFMLVFYHFSNYKYSAHEELASYYNRFSLRERTDLQPIYQSYQRILIENNIEKFHSISCIYVNKRNEFLKILELEQEQRIEEKKIIEEQKRIEEQRRLERSIKWWFKRIIFNALPPIITKILKLKF